MAALSPDDLVQRVLENVGRVVGDLQCPADVIKRMADDVYRRLRRRLSAEFPTLYEALSATQTITSDTITKPTDFEAIRVLEKQYGTGWVTVGVLPSLNRDDAQEQAFYELGTVIKVTPAATAPGTYRMFYLASPPTIITTYDVPNGIEGIIIEEVSAKIRQRHDETSQVQYHKDAAKQIWDEQYMALWNRYGSHGQSCLQITRP